MSDENWCSFTNMAHWKKTFQYNNENHRGKHSMPNYFKYCFVHLNKSMEKRAIPYFSSLNTHSHIHKTKTVFSFFRNGTVFTLKYR